MVLVLSIVDLYVAIITTGDYRDIQWLVTQALCDDPTQRQRYV